MKRSIDAVDDMDDFYDFYKCDFDTKRVATNAAALLQKHQKCWIKVYKDVKTDIDEQAVIDMCVYMYTLYNKSMLEINTIENLMFGCSQLDGNIENNKFVLSKKSENHNLYIDKLIKIVVQSFTNNIELTTARVLIGLLEAFPISTSSLESMIKKLEPLLTKRMMAFVGAAIFAKMDITTELPSFAFEGEFQKIIETCFASALIYAAPKTWSDFAIVFKLYHLDHHHKLIDFCNCSEFTKNNGCNLCTSIKLRD